MLKKNLDRSQSAPAGYAALTERYGLDVVPNWHMSLVAEGGSHRLHSRDGIVEETYPSSYWPGETACDHLEFALKYDGTNLALLSILFRIIDEKEILEHIRSRPTGKYARRLWFFYEFLTGRRLPLEDLKQGNYIDLVEPQKYYTRLPSERVRRQRVNNNLPGDARFCPLIRRTEALAGYEKADLAERCRRTVAAYPPELLTRALGYLYNKETKSSFEIEHTKPSPTRTERFIALLRAAEKEDFCRKSGLIELQNRITDPRFHASEYRSEQNYVGETVAWQGERIHFVGPKPEDLPDLMSGLTAAHEMMESGNVPAVVHAAAVSYGFVFLHPFEDGNGRIHRFLIHNILARRKFTPEGIMFPVSATMLKNLADYDVSLEAFSRKLMPLVEYSLDEIGRMTVHNDTAVWYRYIDMTPQAEALFKFIERTIDTELAGELAFLAGYDRAQKTVREIVDMPDRQIDLFIRFCLQNNGRLSGRKRADYFDFLSDREVAALEEAVQTSFGRSAAEGKAEK